MTHKRYTQLQNCFNDNLRLQSARYRQYHTSWCVPLQVNLDKERYPLLLGGHVSGYISLIYGKGYSMNHPFLAHKGPVLRLASSTLCTDRDGVFHRYLASLGADDILNLWLIQISSEKIVFLCFV